MGNIYLDIDNTGSSTDNDTGAVTNSLNENFDTTTGIESLIQRLTRAFLTLKGSNAYDPDVGSNFFYLFSAISLNDVEVAKVQFPLFLKAVLSGLIEQDAVSIGQGVLIPDEERVQDLILESVEYDETFGGWLVEIRVITKANVSFIISLP